jgi:hypothetical protein
MRRILSAHLFVAALVAIGVTACGGEGAVARVVDGHTIDGHFIEPEAYAEFLDGALLEAKGDLKGAEASYERALRVDGAAEIYARLGRVRCLIARRASDEAFARAKWKGKKIGPVWLADAECALDRGEVARATASAERAAALQPRNAQASVLVVRALVLAGDRDRAARWLRAARLFYSEFAGLPASLNEIAGMQAPSAVSASVSPPGSHRVPAERRSQAAIATLDAALVEGDAPRARAAAVEAGLGNAAIALRAVELGQPTFAKELAELTLAAEPGNVDARIAALAAADLTHDDAALRRYTARLPDLRDPPSTAAIRVMIAVLFRRVGADAARAFGEAWLGTRGTAPTPHAER